jgi:hypothetical protein
VFPEEHGILNTASPASRPFAYSSSFIYPHAETGNLVFNEATAQAEFAGKGRRRKQGELTEDEQRWNDELGRYRTQTESNFFYVGRTSWADFWIEQMTGQVRDPAAIKQYRETAGFDFDKTIHPEDDSVRYEKWWEAVPDFDHQEIGQALRALAGLKDMRPEAALEKIAHVFETLEKARAWSEKLRGLYQGSGFVPQLGKMQTLAGRLAPLLDFALGREDEGGYLSRGLEDTLNAVYKELTAKVSGLVRVQPTGVVRGHQSSLNPIIYSADGKPSYIQVFGSHDQSTAQKNLGENIYNSLAPGKPLYEELKTSVYEAAQAARLVRIGVKTFMDRKWRENVEHEGTRTITDPAYEPEYEPLNRLRDNSLNPRVLQNLSFITTYMQKQRGYWFSPNTGTEMLAEYNNLNFGEGREPYVYTEGRDRKVYLTDDAVKLVSQNPDGTLTHPNVPTYSSLQQDQDGYFYVKQIIDTNFNEVVVTGDQAGFDDPRSRPFLTGEDTPLLEGMDVVKSGSVSSQDRSDITPSPLPVS